MDGSNVEQDQVSPFANLERAGDVIDVHSLGTHAGSHFKRLRSRNSGRVTTGTLGQEGCQAHFFEEVQVVV